MDAEIQLVALPLDEEVIRKAFDRGAARSLAFNGGDHSEASVSSVELYYGPRKNMPSYAAKLGMTNEWHQLQISYIREFDQKKSIVTVWANEPGKISDDDLITLAEELGQAAHDHAAGARKRSAS